MTTQEGTNDAPVPPTMDEIKEEYIYGTIDKNGKVQFLSYQKIADKYKIRIDPIKKAGSKENWSALRKEHRSKTALKVAEKKSERTASSIVQSDDKFEDTGEALRKKVQECIDTVPNLNPYNLLNLSITLVNAQKVVKTAQGEIIDRIKVDSSSNVKLDITNPDFMNSELEFAKKLIKK